MSERAKSQYSQTSDTSRPSARALGAATISTICLFSLTHVPGESYLTPARNPTGPDAAHVRPLATVCGYDPISSVHDLRCHQPGDPAKSRLSSSQLKKTRPGHNQEQENTKQKLDLRARLLTVTQTTSRTFAESGPPPLGRMRPSNVWDQSFKSSESSVSFETLCRSNPCQAPRLLMDNNCCH